MHDIANKYVSVSVIASYYLCPRLAYFRSGRWDGPSDAEVRAGVFKCISYSLSGVVSSAGQEAALGKVISAACADALCIYGPAHDKTILLAGEEIKARAGDIISGLTLEKERRGEPELMRILAPSSAGVAIYSDRLRMSGTIDKAVDFGTGPAPVIISSSAPPENGIYASDRVRLAAYAMLLSEKYGVNCIAGGVEYVPGWCLRTVAVRYEDKRKALYARNRILEAMEGRMPDVSRGNWCGRCSFESTCNVKVSLLDSLFKK